MRALVVIVFHEGRDLLLEFPTGLKIVKKVLLLQRLMPKLNLSLCLGMIGRAADVLDFLNVHGLRQVA